MPGSTPANGDLLECTFCCNTTSQIGLNIIHLQMVTQGATPMSLLDVSQSLDVIFNPLYRALMPTLGIWRGIATRNLMAPRTIMFPYIGNTGPGGPGTTLMPTQTSYIIKLRGYIAGRKAVGHIYPAFPDGLFGTSVGGMTSGAYISLGALASRFATLAAISNGAASSVVQLVIRNKDVTIGGVKVPQWSTVQTVLAIQKWATQRRRGQFGRTNSTPF